MIDVFWFVGSEDITKKSKGYNDANKKEFFKK